MDIVVKICFVVVFDIMSLSYISSLYYILYFVNIVYYVLCVYCLYLRGYYSFVMKVCILFCSCGGVLYIYSGDSLSGC